MVRHPARVDDLSVQGEGPTRAALRWRHRRQADADRQRRHPSHRHEEGPAPQPTAARDATRKGRVGDRTPARHASLREAVVAEGADLRASVLRCRNALAADGRGRPPAVDQSSSDSTVASKDDRRAPGERPTSSFKMSTARSSSAWARRSTPPTRARRSFRSW